ncbi:hypothetical protein GLV98_07225 [Halobacillus litoralis]|uniref:Pectate lyase superfamily protein domain-containing protein n=1 Tax=Halobacillus litoralis TaxID=45668 RepID=A0A845E1Y3_9BACI|nr:hypothetical protein [Halobacillus litoralis]MYL49270.1 hypothetical protein [Halobacillus litoralis]
MNYKVFMLSLAVLILGVLFVYEKYENQHPSLEEDSLKEGVNIEDFGAKGNDDQDDSTAIQEAIEYGVKHGVGKVKLTGNQRFILHKGIVLKQGIELELGKNTTIEVQGDFKVFEIMKNASITNGIIEVSDQTFSSEVLYFDGGQKFWSWETSRIEGLNIINTSEENTGTAIALVADQSNEFISFVDFLSLKIVGFQTGVFMKAEIPNEKYNFVNGNRFINLTLDDCVQCIVIESSKSIPNEVSGNQFTDFQIQLSDATEEVLRVSGSDNRFQGMIWDVESYATESKIVNFSAQSMRNSLISNVNEANIVDQGDNNSYYPSQSVPGP